MSGINQKEYLKKYLGLGKGCGEKKKKKKSKKLRVGLKIVDDDIDVGLNEEIQVDLTADNDEAPQIVSVIDDRPPSLRVDEETRSKLWKPIGAPEEYEQIEETIKIKQGTFKNDRKSPDRKHRESYKSPKLKQKSATSVHVSQHRNKDRSYSPPRRIETHIGSNLNISSPKRHSVNFSPSKKTRSTDSDNSPHRRSGINKNVSPPRQRKNSEDSSSPLRRQHYTTDSDSSPPRRNKVRTQDLSPPRKREAKVADSSPSRRIKQEKSTADNTPPRKPKINISPSRKRKNSGDSSPSRKHSPGVISSKKSKTDRNSSPARRIKVTTEDLSPPRKGSFPESDSTPPRRIKKERSMDNSPPRKRKETIPVVKKSRWDDNEETTEKLKKTLDGKTAGLQNAADLVKETEELKKREDDLFRKLNSEVSGANAATVVRRKTKEIDPEDEARKRKTEEENKEKYNRWGRGLKQVGDINEKIQNEMYEMSKPLARYADDEDLEKHLKEQEREGDPMLAYLRQKKKKKAIEGGAPVTQQYKGDAPPNRFGIRPGYRWDGVDRSNGYEKKWFDVQNSRKASMEENYKWSTEDM